MASLQELLKDRWQRRNCKLFNSKFDEEKIKLGLCPKNPMFTPQNTRTIGRNAYVRYVNSACRLAKMGRKITFFDEIPVDDEFTVS